MELLMVEGCVNNSMTVDGIEHSALTGDMRKFVWDKVVSYLSTLDGRDLNDLLQFTLTRYGDYKVSDEPCEVCGDSTEEWKMTI